MKEKSEQQQQQQQPPSKDYAFQINVPSENESIGENSSRTL